VAVERVSAGWGGIVPGDTSSGEACGVAETPVLKYRRVEKGPHPAPLRARMFQRYSCPLARIPAGSVRDAPVSPPALRSELKKMRA